MPNTKLVLINMGYHSWDHFYFPDVARSACLQNSPGLEGSTDLHKHIYKHIWTLTEIHSVQGSITKEGCQPSKAK